MSVPKPAGRARPWLGWLAAAFLACGAITGIGLIWLGTQADQPVPEPAEFTVIPGQSGEPVPPAPDLMDANQLRIPSLGIDAPLLPGTVSSDLEIPSDPAKLTIFTGGATACDPVGTTLLAGHVISYGVRGALWPLHGIDSSAAAYVTCADGTVTAWRVSQVQVLPKEDLPAEVYARTGRRRLVVVTCGGPVMPNGHFRDNVIVWFEPASR